MPLARFLGGRNPSGRFYPSSKLAKRDPDVSRKSECSVITEYLRKEYGDSPELCEAGYQDEEWIDEKIPKLTGFRRNGRPLHDMDWLKAQKDMGYWLPEVVYLSLVHKMELEDVLFYEGITTSGAPRRL
jgi:hypothetical protein